MFPRPRFRLAALLVLACSDGTAPGEGREPEVERPLAQLLVERYSRAGLRSFYTMTADGRFAAEFGNVPADAVQLFPSPDGRTIAYLREFDDLLHVWLMDRDGDNRRALLDDERVVRHVAWSPDGARLLIAGSTLEQSDDIWVINATGTGLTNLTPDPLPAVYSDLAPDWSPDGSRIVFASNRSGTMHLWTMHADGSNKAQLIPISVPGAERAAAWAPNGTLIAFEGSTAAGGGVGVVQPGGAGYQFFPVSGDVGRVGWLADGRLLYSTNTAGNYELYALQVTSGNVENLTNHSDHDLRARILRSASLDRWLGFGAPSLQATGVADATAIAIGDVISDGHEDLAIAAPALSQVRLLRGSGTGAFQPVGSLDATDTQRDLLSADVSADGIDDIVLLGADGFHVFRGSAGGPGVATAHDVQGIARGIALRDLEGTGVPLITVTAEPADGPAPFHLQIHGDNGTGSGTVIPILDLATDYLRPGRLCVGDITGEGHLDFLAVTATAASSLLLFPGRGDISLEEPSVVAIGLGASRETRAVCADFDGDRRADLALLQPGVRGISMRRSLGSAFAPPATIDVVGDEMVAGDVDRDGDLDLIVASTNASTLLFVRNLGDGRFATPVNVPVGLVPARLALADLNHDGWLDAIAVSGTGQLSVLLNARRG
jgi:dipeptidyl aminopeptidase/acylaminoacyl peptidase